MNPRPTIPIACLLVAFSLTGARPALAQQDGLLHPNDALTSFLMRMQTAGFLDDAHLSHRPLSAYEAHVYLDSVDARATGPRALSAVDRRLLSQYRGLTAYPGARQANRLWGAAFKNGRDLFSAEASRPASAPSDGAPRADWAVQINPILNLSAGRAWFSSDEAALATVGQRTGRDIRNVWRNSRGARVSGHIGPWFFFEGRLTENQMQVVDPAPRGGTAPGLPSVQIPNGDAYDWMETVGVVGLRTNHFEVRFGRDRNLWAHGIGSTMLSDAATAYDQIQVRTSFWRIQYTNLFAALATVGHNTATGFRPRKYTSTHRLALRVTDRVEVGVFETVIFATDSLGTRDRFDLAYANPIIFFRPAERDRGSPDNILLGVTGAYRPVNGLRIYGEFLLDEFASQHFGDAWWANKWAWLVGAHVVDLPVARLDVRAEFTRIRPFIYAHKADFNAWTQFGDALGHAAGPNAWEFRLDAQYAVNARLALSGSARILRQGLNTAENMGADPTESYNTRTRDFGHDFLQGDLTATTDLSGRTTLELLPDLFLDAGLRHVRVDRESTGQTAYVLPTLGLRWGAW